MVSTLAWFCEESETKGKGTCDKTSIWESDCGTGKEHLIASVGKIDEEIIGMERENSKGIGKITCSVEEDFKANGKTDSWKITSWDIMILPYGDKHL